MSEQTMIMIILGMAAVTYIPRVAPLLALSSRNLPEPAVQWLSYVPTAVLSALLAPALLIKDGQLDIGFDNYYLLAAFPAFAVAIKTKSLFAAVVTGMAVVALCRFFAI